MKFVILSVINTVQNNFYLKMKLEKYVKRLKISEQTI